MSNGTVEANGTVYFVSGAMSDGKTCMNVMRGSTATLTYVPATLAAAAHRVPLVTVNVADTPGGCGMPTTCTPTFPGFRR